MADVATEVAPHVDELLNYLDDAWRRLPEMARKIDDWDIVEQIDYIEEWSAKESLIDVLDRLINQPEVTVAQRARYDELQRLRRQYSPILDGLRRS